MNLLIKIKKFKINQCQLFYSANNSLRSSLINGL